MKVPKPRKLKSGSYFIQLRLGGESYPITAPTAEECKKKAQLVKAEHKAGVRNNTTSKNSNISLKQAINDYIDIRRNVLSPSSIRTYTQIRDLYFQSAMNKPIKEINDWQALCNSEAARLSAKTLKTAWAFIRSVLKANNIAAPDVTLPQIIRKDMPWIEPDDIPAFLRAVEGDSCEISILFALHGLRRSEVAALTADKIDLKNKLIRVEGAAVKGEDHGLTYKEENKNSASRRSVPIMIPRLAALLKELKGEPLPIANPNTTCAHINKACVKIGIPPVGTHGLRRSFASLCYHLKLSERETMLIGGWADANTMRQIYIKLSERDIIKAQGKLLSFYENAAEGENATKNANKNANGVNNILQLQVV